MNGHLVLEPSSTGAIFKVTLPVALTHQQAEPTLTPSDEVV